MCMLHFPPSLSLLSDNRCIFLFVVLLIFLARCLVMSRCYFSKPRLEWKKEEEETSVGS